MGSLVPKGVFPYMLFQPLYYIMALKFIFIFGESVKFTSDEDN